MSWENGEKVLFSLTSERAHREGIRIEVNVYQRDGEWMVESSVLYPAENGDVRRGIFRMSPRTARDFAGLLNRVVDRFDAGEFDKEEE